MISKILSSVFTFLVILFIIYAFINLVHFSWMLAEPEGFWGFFYFLGVLGVIVLVLIVAIGVIVFLFAGIIFLFSDFPKNLTLKNIIKPVGSLFLIIAILFINTIMDSGISMYINKKIADRYSYIIKSEKLFNEGKYVEAIEYSKKAYQKYGYVSAPSRVFIISWLFQKTDYGTKRSLTKQYSTIINYAYCLDQNRTDLDLAENLYTDALKLSDTRLLKEEQDYKIFPYLSLADLNLNKGNYTEAERYFNQLLQYTNKSTQDDIEYVCMSQETFASYFLQVGDFYKAKTLRENNITLWNEKDQSRKSLQYLQILLSATSSEIISRDFEEAGKYLVKAQPLAEKRKEKVVYPAFLLMKGIYCNYSSLNGKGNEEVIKKGWYDKFVSLLKENKTIAEKFKSEAETCFFEVLNFEKSANGDKTIGYAQGLHRLASFYIEQGDKIKANQLLKEAKQICEKYKSSNIHLYYSVLLAFTISEYSLIGYDATVKNNFDELEQYHFNKLIEYYTFLTEKERESYKNLIDNNIAPINSIYVATDSPDTREKLYNNIIATKEIALYANENTRNYLETHDSLRKVFYAIIKERDSVETNKKRVATDNVEFSNSILLREKAIQTKISSMPGFTQFDPRAITWENIRDALKENEIAIEFVHSNFNKSEHYYALVIEKEFLAPELIPLFDEAILKNLMNQPGNTKDRINATYGKWKDSLYSIIWKPIEEKYTNIDKAYISVSGILYSVSFPAILNDKNLDVVLLGSTREVAMKDKKGKSYTSAVLVGGVSYGQPIKSNNITERDRSNYSDLPSTLKEVQNIKKILAANNPKIKVDTITNDDATEVKFRNLQNSKPDLIHLATHGYYYSGNSFNPSNSLMEFYSGTNLSPMLKSGIVLAGANNTSSFDTENDGFLSAQEISRLSFPNLDLAVLSACETGLGETLGSEGVFGLQRAFKLAGAKSLIMSLWKVPDTQTAELMGYFYSNYLNGKMTKSLALKQAQLTMKMKTKNNAPFYWGGFILLER